METIRTIMYVIWSIVGLMSIALTVWSMMFYKNFYKFMFTPSKKEDEE